MPILALNKKAKFDYEILETFEAGLVLSGQEVKSIKTGHVSLKGSYVVMKNTEAYLLNAHIPQYKHAGYLASYDPYQSRKLLLKKSELKKLIGKKQEKGITFVPLKIYTKRGRIKLEFGIARGKKKVDKREDIKKREMKREVARKMRQKG